MFISQSDQFWADFDRTVVEAPTAAELAAYKKRDAEIETARAKFKTWFCDHATAIKIEYVGEDESFPATAADVTRALTAAGNPPRKQGRKWVLDYEDGYLFVSERSNLS